MAWAHNGPVRLWFERLGDPRDPAVLLLGGAGKQGTDWPDAFCAMLAARGYGVIRFDQRDTGKSTDFAAMGSDAAGVGAAVAGRSAPVLAYTTADMAADAQAVLDEAGVKQAHLFGRSLGSYIAQLVALAHPERVLSLTLAMAFSRAIGASTPSERLAALDAEQFADGPAFVARQLATARVVGNADYFDADRIAAEAELAWSRGVHRGAVARHFSVGLAAADIRERLADIAAPTQVIHGRLDKVIPLALAEETAAAIPRARLSVLDDMAHEGPPQLWERWTDLFAANAARIN